MPSLAMNTVHCKGREGAHQIGIDAESHQETSNHPDRHARSFPVKGHCNQSSLQERGDSLIVSEDSSTIITVGSMVIDRHDAGTVVESLHIICKLEKERRWGRKKERRKPGSCMGFWDLEVHHQ